MNSGSLFSSRVKFDQLFNNADLDNNIRSHLAKVYATLGMTLMSAAVGVIAHIQWNLGGILSTIACVAVMIYLGMTRQKLDMTSRLGLIALFGFLKGVTIGPLMVLAIAIDPSVIVTAFLGTATVFVCFTMAALLAKRRYWLYLGGILSSALSAMLLMSVFSMFVQSQFVHSIHLYLGLLVFCGYILFDTQVIIEKVSAGENDYVWHAVELFIDFVAVFVRLVIILLENTGDKKKKRRDDS